MTDRSVKVTLSASASTYITTMRQAAEATRAIGRAAVETRSHVNSLTTDAAHIGAAFRRSIADVDALRHAMGRIALPTGGLAGMDTALHQIAHLQDQIERLRANANNPIPVGPVRQPGGSGGSSRGDGASLISAGAIARLAGYTAGVVGLGAAVKSTYSQTASFETALNTLGAVSGANATQMAEAGKAAIALGGDSTIAGASATDAANAMTELAKGGLTVKDSMTAAKGTLLLAAAAGVDAATAAGIQANALNAFGLQAKDAAKVADILANTANAANGEITDFAFGMAQSAAVSHQFGLSLTDNQVLLAEFANAGIKGADAGTSLKSMLVNLLSPTKAQTAAQEKLGLTVFDSSHKFEGARALSDQLAASKKKLSQQDFLTAASTVFGTDAVRAASVAADNGAKGFDKLQVQIDKSGGAAAVGGAKMKGLGGSFANLQNQIETAQVTLGEKFSPAIQKVVGGLSNAIPKITGFLTGSAFGGGLSKLGTWFQPLIDGAKALITTAWPYIQNFAHSVSTGFSSIIAFVKPVVDGIGGLFKQLTANGTISTFGAALDQVGKAGAGILNWLKPFGGYIGETLKFFGSLGPVVDTAVIAMTALKVLPIGSMLRGVATSAAAATYSLGTTGLAGAASAAMGGLSKAASFIAGPWGLALAGAGIAVYAWINHTKTASAVTRDFSGVLDTNTGALSANAAERVAESVKADLVAFQAAGGSVEDYTQALLGNKTAQADVASQISAIGAKAIEGTTTWRNYGAQFKAAGITSAEVASALSGNASALQDLKQRYSASGLAQTVGDFSMGLGNLGGSLTATGAIQTQYAANLSNNAATIKADTAVYVGSGRAAADAAAAWAKVPAFLRNGQDIDKAGRVAAAAFDAVGSAVKGAGAKAKDAKFDTSAFFTLVTDKAGKTTAITGLSAAFDHYNSAVSAADTTTQLFVFTMDKLAGRNVSVEDAMTANASAARGIGKAYRDQAAAAQAVTDAQAKLVDVQNHLNDKNKTTRTTSSDVAAAQRAVADATDAQTSSVDGLNAADTAYQKTAAMRITQVAMHAVKQSGFTLAVKQSTAEMQRQRDAFIAQQPAADIASGAAAKLADKYGLIPKNVTTILKGDPVLAIAAAKEAKDKADAFAKAKHEAKITADNRDAVAKVHGVQVAMDGVKDKTVKLIVDAIGATKTGSYAPSLSQEQAAAQAASRHAAGGYISGPGSGTSDSIPAMLSNGEFVVNAKSTAANLPLLNSMNAQRYAAGGLVGSLDVQSGGTGNINAAIAGVNAVYAKASKDAAKHNDAARAAANAVPHASSAGVEQWRALAMSVAAAKGENAASVQVMLNQMSRESSGNPAAINLTDSNALAGHPSVGLLQFIPSTFQSFADPGYSSNIYDPQSQMRAWYNYINSRYGGYQSFGARGYGAYASGGLVSGPGTGTSDSIPARVSNGEYVVNAKSTSANIGLLHAINGYASGGLVGTAAIAGIGAPQLGDRQSNVVSALADLAQTIADARTKAADAAAKQHEAQVQSIQAHIAARVAERKYQQEVAAASKAKTAAEKRHAAASVAAADRARKAAEATYDSSSKTWANAKATATAASRNVTDTARAQKNLQSTYHNLQATAARYDSVTSRLGDARGNLASTKADKAQAAAGYATGVAGYGGGITGYSDVRGTSASVINGMKFDLGKIQAFNSDIKKLAKEGLSAGLLTQLVNAFGSGGEITAHALASGPLANIKAANTIQGAITATSNAIGQTTASAQFNPVIRSQQNLVNSLASQQRALNASLVRYAARVEVNLRNALTGWSVQLNAQGLAKLVDQGHKQAARR